MDGTRGSVGLMLVPLPVRTFDDIARLSYRLEVYCSSCRKSVPFDAGDPRLAGKRFTHERWPCSTVRQIWTAEPPQPCGGVDYLYIRPPKAIEVLPGEVGPYSSLSSPLCIPYWEIKQARHDVEPWRTMWDRQRHGIACPRCRGRLSTSWSGEAGRPFTQSYKHAASIAP